MKLQSIGGLIERAANRHGARPWLHFDGRTTTFGEFERRTARAAAQLQRLGLTRGDRAVFCAPNSDDLVVQWLAANRLGVVFVPLNPAAPAADLAGVIDQARPGALVLDPAAEASNDLASAADRSQPVAWIGEIAAGTEEARSFPAVEAGEVAVFIATSGTTGRPKLVMQTHGAYLLAGESFPWWLGLDETDRLMTTLPLFHLNAQAYSTMGSLSAGSEFALLQRFSPRHFWQQAIENGATEINAIGAMVEILMRQDPSPAEQEHRVRVIYTAPAFPESRHREIEKRFGLDVVVGYALSESPFGTIWPRGEKPYGTMGRLRQHPELGDINSARIVDDDGREVQPGRTGELLLRNPAVMKGYFDLPDVTASTLQNGWLHTGDLVTSDEDGCMTFVSRKKHVIRRRGENLSAAEVEAVLEAHRSVYEAAVVGVASDLSDEEVKAFVLAGPEMPSREDLWAWCDERLTRFKVPRYIEFVAEFPRTPTQRIAKHELPHGLTGQEHDREAGRS